MRLSDFHKFACQLGVRLGLGNNIMEGHNIVIGMKIKELQELFSRQ